MQLFICFIFCFLGVCLSDQQGHCSAAGSDCACAPQGQTIDARIAIIRADEDQNGDGMVDYANDLSVLAKTVLDKDGDGSISEAECVGVMQCRYGNNIFVARYLCADFLKGEPSVEISSLNIEPFITGFPLNKLMAAYKQIYISFYKRVCVNEEISLDRKLEYMAEDNNFDNDNNLTATDVFVDLSYRFDLDGDGNVQFSEWIVWWICRYGDSLKFARYTWDQFVPPGKKSIPNDFFSTYPDFVKGLPLKAFTDTMVRKMYTDFEALKTRK